MTEALDRRKNSVPEDVPALEVQGLSFSYGDRRALNNVELSVGQGEMFALLGPNGGGKTTLFRIASTLLRPAAGSVRIFGLDVTKRPDAVRDCIGVVFQSPSLDRKLRVRENLTHQGHLYGMWGAPLGRRIDELLERFGLKGRSTDLVDTLSGGLRRRVEIAKGLLHDPGLLLLDEPSTGLDPAARADLSGHLRTLASEGVSIVVTTHLMEEADACDRLALLDQGNVVAHGTPDTLKAEVGGDVIWFGGQDLTGLQNGIRDRFQAEARIVDGLLRVERDRGHEFLTEVIEAFPGAVRSATLSKPSLEDVFFQRTGHLLREDEVTG